MFFLLLFVLFIGMQSVEAASASVAKKVISETLEAAAKKSGKTLTPAVREASEHALKRACKQYGDDVMKAVAHGGLEALEQGEKHGKLFWELCAHVPQAARNLAIHADDIMPIAKRIGPEFLQLEAILPGLGKQAVGCFGDDAVHFLIKLPKEDAAKLIGYGLKADSSATSKLLLECSQKTGGKILQHLEGKRIVALGLSAAMVTAAYKISTGVEEGIKTTAEQSPEQFTRIATYPVTAVAVVVLIFLAWLFFPLRRLLKRKSKESFETQAVPGSHGSQESPEKMVK
ncbi:MAG: hypothetical protein J6X55_09155 [Victivallales bacterium]|nr:hypothetical protein [Victivallales bacterium]